MQKDIDNFIINRPHVFILGAGASKAALPEGDLNGLECPVMDRFLEVSGLEHIISGIPLKTHSRNLEDIYSELHESGAYPNVLKQLDNGISDYFKQFILPYSPTIYDYLILSLRRKDAIFTFNWDDLIVQAYLRALSITKDLPKLYFLHGNIAMGYCDQCNRLEYYADKVCSVCGHKLRKQPLLYPIKNKDYKADISIANAWDDFGTAAKVRGRS